MPGLRDWPLWANQTGGCGLGFFYFFSGTRVGLAFSKTSQINK
jgi:hypothetical protein